MLSFLTSLAAGLDFGSGVGRMEGGLSTSYEAIARLGPGGSFLTDEHTLRFLHSDECGHFPFFNRPGMEGGGSTILERAHKKVARLLAEHP
jgi:trimethylamine:corrinoid methyltransferase-like protein